MQTHERMTEPLSEPPSGSTPEMGTAVKKTIAASQTFLLSQQYPEGYWWAELESNVSITAEALLLHKIWGTDKGRNLDKVGTYLRQQQRDHGGWELFYGDGGELSASIEAYMALRLLGVPATDPALTKARSFILDRGGIAKSRVFTKLHLALIGCYSWRGIPSIPAWIMLLPDSYPIYEMSSWARGSTVPLLVVFDKKPVFAVDPLISLDELYTPGTRHNPELPSANDWTDIFLYLDSAFKVAEDLNLVPFRDEGLKAAEQWVLERQEVTGDWGGIIPAMLNSMLCLRCLNYRVDDPVIERGFQALDNFAIETDTTYRMQPCISPVWDTAWVMRACVESGMEPTDPRLVQAGEWLLQKQILDYGDWLVKNPQGQPGGWAFEFDNRFYPDLDDTAVVVMALNRVEIPKDNLRRQAMKRAVDWCASMQCEPGGWGAFDINNDQEWLNWLPYGDLKAMIDPNTEDVTARVLEMLGETGLTMDRRRVDRALAYLQETQCEDGSWFGRWGVNYIYGTSGVLSALALVAPPEFRPALERGANWLAGCQNADGGWGETCLSYNDPIHKGQGDSTASQTAWALIGLLAAGQGTGKWAWDAIDRGVSYLTQTQLADGRWHEDFFTGTGFPCHFYLKYHYYQHYFPLLALGRYQNCRWA
ncbi:squalene--hopene cyclase [Prochlorothrix hollandica]|uniref:squalene--hopene cyclase n=1 Tax=Prochlorothrix hollandica TaxID=1223 RepID=UPI00333F7C74